MKVKSILTNKYTLSVFILLFLLGLDIILHKGMSRVMLPDSFVGERAAQHFALCEQVLLSKEKNWKKAINTVEKIKQLDAGVAGFEMDVYFDTTRNCLHVYHDSSGLSTLTIDSVLDVYKLRNLSSSLWLDFKNLSSINEEKSLLYISFLRNKYNLKDKLIIESSSAQNLQSFCDSGFFTSYYVPFFNPYVISKKELKSQLDRIERVLKENPVSALSGYYFQYPVLKNYFPSYPILTWADNSTLSVVTNSFNRSLLNDSHVKVVLYP
jgi:heptose-I-phosphate ethanolaminephosphotransferase